MVIYINFTFARVSFPDPYYFVLMFSCLSELHIDFIDGCTFPEIMKNFLRNFQSLRKAHIMTQPLFVSNKGISIVWLYHLNSISASYRWEIGSRIPSDTKLLGCAGPDIK